MTPFHLRIELAALLRSLYVDLAAVRPDPAQLAADAVVARHLCGVVPLRDEALLAVLSRIEAGPLAGPIDAGRVRTVLREAADRL